MREAGNRPDRPGSQPFRLTTRHSGVVGGCLAIGAFACALAGCGSGASTSSDAASYTALIGAGTHLLQAGNTNAAEQLFRQAISRDPHNAVGYYDLGIVFDREGDTAQALRQYSLALAADPGYVPALYNQAVIYGTRNPQLAIFYYRQVISLQPNSPTAYLNLGLMEAGAGGQQAQALHDLTKAVQLDPTLRDSVPASLRAQLG